MEFKEYLEWVAKQELNHHNLVDSIWLITSQKHKPLAPTCYDTFIDEVFADDFEDEVELTERDFIEVRSFR